jgi:mannose-6-phosphate isomerase
MRPIELEPNFIARFYRGGEGIARLRGVEWPNEYVPEDWLGSSTTVWDSDVVGITRLADGSLLSDAFMAQPEAFFGKAHVERYGSSPALLVKLLEGAQRLPVHFHPSHQFAQAYLGSRYGKTEAWYVVAAGADAEVRLGFEEEVAHETVLRWVLEQDVDSMFGSLKPIRVAPGDTVFVPAGIPHAIGEDVLILELQEPSDLSVLMEWTGFEVDGQAEGHMGLGFDAALAALDRGPMTEQRLAALLKRAPSGGRQPGALRLFPESADDFFTAQLVTPGEDGAALARGFAIALALEGAGSLTTASDETLPLSRGDAYVIPHAAGPCRVSGDVRVVCSRPPAART